MASKHKEVLPGGASEQDMLRELYTQFIENVKRALQEEFSEIMTEEPSVTAALNRLDDLVDQHQDRAADPAESHPRYQFNDLTVCILCRDF